MMETLITLAILTLVVSIYKSKTFRSRLRVIRFGKDNYVRFWPNPGYRLGRHKWSVFYKGRIK